MKIGRFIVEIIKRKVNHDLKKTADRVHIDLPNKYLLDINYCNDDNPSHTLDIFYANDNPSNITIIDIHGGSYILGNKRFNAAFVNKFVDTGINAIAIDYEPNDGRKSIKDLIDQCAKGLDYIFNHEMELGLKDTRYVITGDSAGGHIAMILALAMNNKEYAKQLGYVFNRRAELLLLNSPVYDFVNMGKFILNKSGLKRLIGPNYDDNEAKALISPKEHIDLLDVPIFVSTCKKDFIRQETISLINDLAKLGKQHSVVDIKEKDVGHVHNVTNPNNKSSIIVNNEMIKFIYKFLS